MCITFEKLKDVEHKHVLPMGLMLSPIQTEKKILESMDEDTYEELVASWAFSCLDEYSDCYRIGGAGDHGIDVLAIVSNTPKIFISVSIMISLLAPVPFYLKCAKYSIMFSQKKSRCRDFILLSHLRV